MPQKIREVMTRNPITLPTTASLTEAAQKMRDSDIGDVLVVDEAGALAGIATDRDIVVRSVADGCDPNRTQLGQVCSNSPVKVHEDDTVQDTIELMKRKAIRRVPVVCDGKPVGIVTLGDLAETREPKSALGAISSAAPNH